MKEKFYLLISLLFVFLVTLTIFSRNWIHYPHGDGVDYVLMTESFFNHGTPDLQPKDALNYLNYKDKRDINIYRAKAFTKALEVEPGKNDLNYYTSKANQKLYNFHFWFYSLISLPARVFLWHLDADISIAYLMTNLLILYLGVWMIFHLKQISLRRKIFLSLLMIFSPIFWYLDWAHTEVYSSVLIFLSLLYFFEKRYYLALLFSALAAIQNQALILVSATIGIYILYREGIRWKVLLKAGLCSIWAFLPMIFYFYHFGDYSLIDGEHYLESRFMSWKRVWSLFFDLNQGMILGIPLILFGLFFFLIKDLIKRKFRLEYLFLLPFIAMVAVIIKTTNWNHGSVVMNRYAVWCGVLLIVIFEHRLRELKAKFYYLIISLVIISQAILIFSQHNFNYVYYWSSNELNSLTRYIWANHPSWYNPEPQIFQARVQWPELSYTDSVRVYTTLEDKIVKMQVTETSIEQLKKRGVEPHKVDSIKSELNYHRGYAYIDLPLLENLGYRQEKDTLIARIEAKKKLDNMIRMADDLREDDEFMEELEESEADLDSLIRVESENRYYEWLANYKNKKR